MAARRRISPTRSSVSRGSPGSQTGSEADSDPCPVPILVPPPDKDDKCGNQGFGAISYGLLRDNVLATGAWARITFTKLNTGAPASVDQPGFVKGAKIDRGHLLARRRGGTGSDLANIVALYDNPNRGRMCDFERRVAEAVEDCETMTHLSTPTYGGGSLPVSAISVQAVGHAGDADADVCTNELP